MRRMRLCDGIVAGPLRLVDGVKDLKKPYPRLALVSHRSSPDRLAAGRTIRRHQSRFIRTSRGFCLLLPCAEVSASVSVPRKQTKLENTFQTQRPAPSWCRALFLYCCFIFVWYNVRTSYKGRTYIRKHQTIAHGCRQGISRVSGKITR